MKKAMERTLESVLLSMYYVNMWHLIEHRKRHEQNFSYYYQACSVYVRNNAMDGALMGH